MKLKPNRANNHSADHADYNNTLKKGTMYATFGKRTLDLLIAIPALVVLFPIMLLVALWIKLESKGPALFRQKRSGQGRIPFTMYKFRSMAHDTPSDMPTNNFANAGAYITRSGKILRKLSIDELPQLLNIIRGDMSIVGPRPVIFAEKKLLDLRDKASANAVKPGITGWAQVNGRDHLSPGEKAELDGFYAKRISLRFDVKCILKTIWIVVALIGHSEGHEEVNAHKKAEAATNE